uniref:Protein containing Kinetochor Ybp2 domain n=1 Tax=Rhipicephalus zambeziensis TaxID=60191 RepID=A0A224Y482_9ACAR
MEEYKTVEEMDCHALVAQVVELLNSQRYSEAISFILEAPSDTILAYGWDLVLPVLSAMQNEVDAKSDENASHCKDLLEVVTSCGKPKEVLISLLEHLQLIKSSVVFGAVLQCIQKLLPNLSRNRLVFLDLILESLHSHLKPLSASVAKSCGDQAADGSSTESQESRNLGDCLNAVAEFFSDITLDHRLQEESGTGKCTLAENDLILRYLLLFLGDTAVLDLRIRANVSPPNVARLSAQRLLSHISKRSADLIKLSLSGIATQNEGKASRTEDTGKDPPEPVSPICCAVLAWLIFVENLEQDSVPCVYTNRYIFEHSLQSMMVLLSHNSGHVVSKGVALCANLVSRLSLGEFCYMDLDNTNLIALLRCLGKVMIYSSSSVARRTALSTLVDYIKCFKHEARYILYCRMLQVEKHAGFRGLLIDCYRQDMHAALKASIHVDTFWGTNFLEFVKILSNFSSQDQMNILDDSDCVLAVLNLIQYFASVLPYHSQQCKEANQSICEIARKYAEQVKESVDQTRAHYKVELEHNKEKVRGCDVQSKDSLFPCLPPEQEAEVLKTALTRLDLVESVLVLALDSVSHCSKKSIQ